MSTAAGEDRDICCCGHYRRFHGAGVRLCSGRHGRGVLCDCKTFRLYSYGPPARDRQIEDEAAARQFHDTARR